VTVRLRAPAERARLCDLLDERGPDAPTLCAGWRTGDLAAHLVVREHSVFAAAGIFLPVLAPVTVRAMARVRQRPFPAVVDRIRRGGLLPAEGRLGEALHLLEFVVHREDILRASPDLGAADLGAADLGAPDAAPVDAGLQDAVFTQLRRSAHVLGRNVPSGVGVLLRSSTHGSIDVRRGPAVLVVDGAPVELALWLFGRVSASRVSVERHGGPDDTVARVESSLRR
jgi:uncharacterized protein (TIGR03085 family)